MEDYEAKQLQKKLNKAVYNANTDRLKKIINLMPEPHHTYTVNWTDIEKFIDAQNQDGGFNDSPDYQRGHVWNEAQQISFIENVYRGIVPKSLLSIRINNPMYDEDVSEHYFKGTWISDLPFEVQVVDGKQRLTAIRKFMRDELVIFGELKCSDLNNSAFTALKKVIEINTTAFTTQASLLQYYLDLNSGGTVHTEDELQKVRNMLNQCHKNQ